MLPVAVPGGRFITATATAFVHANGDPSAPLVPGDTSEFSQAFMVALPSNTRVDVNVAADQSSVSAGNAAGFVLTIRNDGADDAAGLTFSAPLPAGLGNDINWQVDPASGDAGSFQITGGMGNQVLSLAPDVTELPQGGSLTVHVTGLTSGNDAAPDTLQGSLVLTATVDALNEAAQDHNSQGERHDYH